MDTTQVTQDASPFLATVSQSIQNWLESKDERSVRAVEYYSEVSRNYITRLMKQEISESKLDVFKLYSVLKVVAGDQEASKLILQNENLKDRFLKVMGLPEEMVSMVKMSNELDHLVRQREVGLTYLLAANSSGTTIEQVTSVCGDKAFSAIGKLLEFGYIVNNNGKIQLAQEYRDSIISFSRETCKFLIPNLVAEYSPERSGKEWNNIAAISESVNRTFQKRIVRKMSEFRTWVQTEMKKEENLGDIPLFVTLTMDTLTTPVLIEGGLQ